MADPVRLLRLGTVIWFGGLEFMSLGHEYDMVLLTPRAPPTDGDVTHRQPRRRRCPGGRSRRARQARREQDHHNATRIQDGMPLPTVILRPAVGTGSLAGDLSSLSLDEGKTPVAHGDAQSPSSAPSLPEEPVSAKQSPATVPSSYPFGLRNAATSYAYAYAAAHKDPPERRQRFTLNLGTHADSFEEDEAWPGVDFSGLHDPGAMRRFLAASDYCFGYFDSDDEGTYDPTRECFHIELGMPRMGDEDAGTGNRSPPHWGTGDTTPPRVVSPTAWNENPAPRTTSTSGPGAAP